MNQMDKASQDIARCLEKLINKEKSGSASTSQSNERELGGFIDELKGRLGRLETSVGKLLTKDNLSDVEKLEIKMTQVVTKLKEEVKKSKEDGEYVLDKLQGRLGELEGKIQILEGAAVSDVVKRFGDRMLSLERRRDAIKKRLSDIGDRVETFSNALRDRCVLYVTISSFLFPEISISDDMVLFDAVVFIICMELVGVLGLVIVGIREYLPRLSELQTEESSVRVDLEQLFVEIDYEPVFVQTILASFKRKNKKTIHISRTKLVLALKAHQVTCLKGTPTGTPLRHTNWHVFKAHQLACLKDTKWHAFSM